ncbi:hypothetical protein V8F06_000868 [Rhypophila decipiens]
MNKKETNENLSGFVSLFQRSRTLIVFASPQATGPLWIPELSPPPPPFVDRQDFSSMNTCPPHIHAGGPCPYWSRLNTIREALKSVPTIHHFKLMMGPDKAKWRDSSSHQCPFSPPNEARLSYMIYPIHGVCLPDIKIKRYVHGPPICNDSESTTLLHGTTTLPTSRTGTHLRISISESLDMGAESARTYHLLDPTSIGGSTRLGDWATSRFHGRELIRSTCRSSAFRDRSTEMLGRLGAYQVNHCQ